MPTIVLVTLREKNRCQQTIPRFAAGSFAVHIGDQMRFGIICGSIWGSFPAWGSFPVGDHLRRCTVLTHGSMICQLDGRLVGNYNLAKYFCYLLKPHISSEFCATDTFSLVKEIQDADFSDMFMASYDVTSITLFKCLGI